MRDDLLKVARLIGIIVVALAVAGLLWVAVQFLQIVKLMG